MGAAVTPTCIFREEVDAVGGGKARSASSSSGSRTCNGREGRGQLQGSAGLCVALPQPPCRSPPTLSPASPCLGRCVSDSVAAPAAGGRAHTQGRSLSLRPDQPQSHPAVGQRQHVVRDPQAGWHVPGVRQTQTDPHQLLGLCLEGRVDTNDEWRGCAEDLQQLGRQDGHVGEAATGQGSAWWAPQRGGRAKGPGQRAGGGHLYRRGNSSARSPRQASERRW